MAAVEVVVESVDHRPDLLQHRPGRAEGPQPVGERPCVRREQEGLADVEPDAGVAGDQGGRVEQGHALGQRAPPGGIGELGEGTVLPGQGQDLGHAGLAPVGVDHSDEDVHRGTRDVATGAGLVPHVCHVN